jgi:uncharacterized protein (TIGR02246 family)
MENGKDRRCVLALGLAAATALAAPGTAVMAAEPQEREIRAHFERFVAAQNARDAEAVGETLLDAPDFLWITPRGETIWGRAAAMERFRAAHRGTWQLEPEMAQFRAKALGDGAAQVFVPVVLTAGPPGQTARPVRLLVNQTLVRTGSGWRIASILPVTAPAAQ